MLTDFLSFICLGGKQAYFMLLRIKFAHSCTYQISYARASCVHFCNNIHARTAPNCIIRCSVDLRMLKCIPSFKHHTKPLFGFSACIKFTLHHFHGHYFLHKRPWKMNDIFVSLSTKTQGTHVFIILRSGATGVKRLPFSKHYAQKWESKFTLGWMLKKHRLYGKIFQIKVVENYISYKKLTGRTCLSPPGVERGGSKYWHVWNIILYWNGKADSF